MNSTSTSRDLEFIRSRTFDEISVGDRASIQRTLTAALVRQAICDTYDLFEGCI